MLRDGSNGYKTYVFEESTRRYAIDRKGQGHKEVIYLRVADISYTRGVRKSTGLSYKGPCGGVPWQCFIQKYKDSWHPVAYYSRKITPLELNYNIYNKELLGIVTVLKE